VVFNNFQNFASLVENQFNKKIKIFRSDNRTEFVNENFTKFFKEEDIIHQISYVYTPQQNDVFQNKKSSYS
jgi:transposase InsO family protein